MQLSDDLYQLFLASFHLKLLAKIKPTVILISDNIDILLFCDVLFQGNQKRKWFNPYTAEFLKWNTSNPLSIFGSVHYHF